MDLQKKEEEENFLMIEKKAHKKSENLLCLSLFTGFIMHTTKALHTGFTISFPMLMAKLTLCDHVHCTAV